MTTTAPAPSRGALTEAQHSRRWWVLAVLALSQLTVVLDGTIVSIALPQAQTDLGISDLDRQWVVTAYALPFGALLLLGGRIADYWGRKRTFLVGMVGFALASAVGGLAQNGIELFLARAGQGVFAALLAPAALAVLTVTFTEPSERAKAFAVFGAIAGGGAAVGLVLGGVLTEYLNWRWCLLVNIPVAAVAVVAASKLMWESKAEGDTHYDLPGAVLVAAGLGSLVYGFTRAERGWTQPATLGFIALGLVLLVAFVLVERRTANPLLPMSVPVHRDRGAAFIGSTLVGAALLGGILYLTFYLQIVLGYTPIAAGLASLPMTAAILVSAGITSQLLPRTGPRPLMAVGPVLATAGFLLLTRIGVDTAYLTHVLPGLLLVGFGLGLLMVPMQSMALVGVKARDAGAASALVNATIQIGGALGTALFTTIYASAKTTWAAGNAAPVPPEGVDPAALGGSGAAPSAELLASLPAPVQEFLARAQDYAFSTEVAGYTHAFAWAGAIMIVITPLVLLLVRATKHDVGTSDGPVHLG